MFETERRNEYQAIFQMRGDLYNAANRLCPSARETERSLLLDLLDLRAGHILCDTAAGGGYLADGAAKRLPGGHILCLDPSVELARGLNPAYARMVAAIDRIPLRDASIDRVASV